MVVSLSYEVVVSPSDGKWTAALIKRQLTCCLSKSFTVCAPHSVFHTHVHTEGSRQPCRDAASSSGAVRVTDLAQGHLDL